MTDVLDPLVLDLVEWVAKQPRPYAEMLDAWRTSCPRLTVWEDAIDRGLVRRTPSEGGTIVMVTEGGRRFLSEHHRAG
jgi:CTP-dependent riboflavin kinase